VEYGPKMMMVMVIIIMIRHERKREPIWREGEKDRVLGVNIIEIQYI
jgi:hypothetical protein